MFLNESRSSSYCLEPDSTSPCSQYPAIIPFLGHTDTKEVLYPVSGHFLILLIYHNYFNILSIETSLAEYDLFPSSLHLTQRDDKRRQSTMKYFAYLLKRILGPVQPSRYRDSIQARRSVVRTPVVKRFPLRIHTGNQVHPASPKISRILFVGGKVAVAWR
jgi:hypothetical protein